MYKKRLQVGGGGALVAILLINGAFFGTYIAVTACVFGFSCSLVLLLMHLYNLVPLVTFVDVPFWVSFGAKLQLWLELTTVLNS